MTNGSTKGDLVDKIESAGPGSAKGLTTELAFFFHPSQFTTSTFGPTGKIRSVPGFQCRSLAA